MSLRELALWLSCYLLEHKIHEHGWLVVPALRSSFKKTKTAQFPNDIFFVKNIFYTLLYAKA